MPLSKIVSSSMDFDVDNFIESVKGLSEDEIFSRLPHVKFRLLIGNALSPIVNQLMAFSPAVTRELLKSFIEEVQAKRMKKRDFILVVESLPKDEIKRLYTTDEEENSKFLLGVFKESDMPALILKALPTNIRVELWHQTAEGLITAALNGGLTERMKLMSILILLPAEEKTNLFDKYKDKIPDLKERFLKLLETNIRTFEDIEVAASFFSEEKFNQLLEVKGNSKILPRTMKNVFGIIHLLQQTPVDIAPHVLVLKTVANAIAKDSLLFEAYLNIYEVSDVVLKTSLLDFMTAEQIAKLLIDEPANIKLLVGNIPDAKLSAILGILLPNKRECYDENNRLLSAISFSMPAWPADKCNTFLANLNLDMLINSVPIIRPFLLTLFKLANSLPKESVKYFFDLLGREKIQQIFNKKNHFSQFKEILKSADPNILIYLLAKIDKKNIVWDFKRLSTALYMLRRIENDTNVNTGQQHELIQVVLHAIKSLPVILDHANEEEIKKELSIIIGRLSRLDPHLRDILVDMKFPEDVLIGMIDRLSSLKAINGILAFLPAERHQPFLDAIPETILDKCIATDLATGFPDKPSDLSTVLVDNLYEYTTKGSLLGVSANNSEMKERILDLYPFASIENEIFQLKKMVIEFKHITTRQQEHVQLDAKSDSLDVSRNKVDKANIMLKANIAVKEFLEKPELGTQRFEHLIAVLMLLRNQSAAIPHIGIKNTMFNTPSTTTRLIDEFIKKTENFVDPDVLDAKLAEISGESNVKIKPAQ
jgi:hypothetical protein